MTPTCWSLPFVVVQPEQQRADDALAALVPAEAGDDAIGGADVLDLDHGALAGLVAGAGRLGDDAVEARALEAIEPLGRERAIARHRSQVNRRHTLAEQGFETSPALAQWSRAEIEAVDRQQVEADKTGRRRLGQLRDARRRRMQPQLQGVEVEPLRRGNHDLPVDDAPRGQALAEHRMKVGKVPVERPQIAALNVDVRRTAEHDRAEAIPFRLVEKALAPRQHVSHLRQHRLDRRRNRERCHREMRDTQPGQSRLSVPGPFRRCLDAEARRGRGTRIGVSSTDRRKREAISADCTQKQPSHGGDSHR